MAKSKYTIRITNADSSVSVYEIEADFSQSQFLEGGARLHQFFDYVGEPINPQLAEERRSVLTHEVICPGCLPSVFELQHADPANVR